MSAVNNIFEGSVVRDHEGIVAVIKHIAWGCGGRACSPPIYYGRTLPDGEFWQSAREPTFLASSEEEYDG